jgi:predicted transposase/invertase (TIGR01784 family)
MTELKHKFTNDILFKMLFVKYPHLLKKLVAVLLGVSLDSIKDFTIRNPEMPPESLGDKFCRLDISMTVNEQRIDLEVQVEDEKDYPERSLFHWAREYSNALPKGGKYADLPRTIIISIIDFPQFDCEEYYSEFQALEVRRHEPLSDKFALYFFELPKLPESVKADNGLELWLSLFRAKTEDELKNIEALEVPEMTEAIQAYRHITVTPEFREAERLRTKARHDEAQALYNERRKEKFDIAKNLLEINLSVEQIMTATSLTHAEIESLRNSI